MTARHGQVGPEVLRRRDWHARSTFQSISGVYRKLNYEESEDFDTHAYAMKRIMAVSLSHALTAEHAHTQAVHAPEIARCGRTDSTSRGLGLSHWPLHPQ